MKNSNFILSSRPPIERIRDTMKVQRKNKMTYSQISAFWGISKGTAWRIIKLGYEPKTPAIRAKLGLPEIVIVPVYRNNKGRFTRRG